MASNRNIRARGCKTLTRKIPYRRILKQTIVVGMPRKYISIVY